MKGVCVRATISRREVERMKNMPTADEQATKEIDIYAMLQRIKADSKEENPALEYEIKISEAKLHTLGVNTENLKK